MREFHVAEMLDRGMKETADMLLKYFEKKNEKAKITDYASIVKYYLKWLEACRKEDPEQDVIAEHVIKLGHAIAVMAELPKGPKGQVVVAKWSVDPAERKAIRTLAPLVYLSSHIQFRR